MLERILIRSIFLFFLLISYGFADQIKQIEIYGNERVSDETIKMFTKVNLNDDIDDLRLNEILKDFLKRINIEEGKLFFINSNDTRHNIFGLWSLDLMDKLREDLDKGERKVEVWANSVGVKVINMDFEKDDPFFNINTKEDLEKAKAKIGND